MCVTLWIDFFEVMIFKAKTLWIEHTNFPQKFRDYRKYVKICSDNFFYASRSVTNCAMKESVALCVSPAVRYVCHLSEFKSIEAVQLSEFIFRVIPSDFLGGLLKKFGSFKLKIKI